MTAPRSSIDLRIIDRRTSWTTAAAMSGTEMKTASAGRKSAVNATARGSKTSTRRGRLPSVKPRRKRPTAARPPSAIQKFGNTCEASICVIASPPKIKPDRASTQAGLSPRHASSARNSPTPASNAK
jgi:hypothetical protein